MPTFGHSENHAGLQLVDLIASAVVFPSASFTYCTDHVSNVHVQPRFEQIRSMFGPRLRSLQFRYQDDGGKWRGGIVVHDAIGERNGSLLFG